MRLVVTSFIILTSIGAWGGPGTKGTEAEKLYLQMVLSDPVKAQVYHNAINEIGRLAQSEFFKASMIVFLQQVPLSDVDKVAARKTLGEMEAAALKYEISQSVGSIQIPYDFSRAENPEPTKALAKEVLATTYLIQETPCIDSAGVPREATTDNQPRATTCLYPRGLALLYTMGKSTEYNYSEANFIFGALNHELARKYSLDEDHSFFLSMIAETGFDLVFDQDCYTSKPFCPTRNISGQTNGIISWSPSLAKKIQVSISMPKPKGRWYGGTNESWIWYACMKKGDNFLVLENMKEGTEPFHKIPYGEIIPPLDKLGNFGGDIDLIHQGVLVKSVSGRRDIKTITVLDKHTWEDDQKKVYQSINLNPGYGTIVLDNCPLDSVALRFDNQVLKDYKGTNDILTYDFRFLVRQ